MRYPHHQTDGAFPQSSACYPPIPTKPSLRPERPPPSPDCQANDKRCLRLAQLASRAVDAAKTGKFATIPPDLMPERKNVKWPHWMVRHAQDSASPRGIRSHSPRSPGPGSYALTLHPAGMPGKAHIKVTPLDHGTWEDV